MEIPNDPETKYNCQVCNYKCIYPAHWKQHIESEKHKNWAQINEEKVSKSPKIRSA